jgi:L-lactate utilization protein LutC
MSADAVLAAIRAALGRPAGAPVPPPPPVPLLGPVDLDAATKVAQFGERLAVAGGRLHVPAAGDVVAVLQDLLRQSGARTVLHSDAPEVVALLADPRLAGTTFVPATASRGDLLAADLGLSTAQWGIAETGTLVLDAAAERHRCASLLPVVHVALLRQSRILATLGEALKTLPRPLSPAITLITGPSRTADIELQLVVGVHGPRELHVIVCS